jgi:HEAT repeat protein
MGGDLIVLLDSKQPILVKTAAVDGLGKLRFEEAIKPLEEQLYAQDNYRKGSSLWIRIHIVSALGQINSPEVVAILEKATEDKDEAVREEAKLQLARIKG